MGNVTFGDISWGGGTGFPFVGDSINILWNLFRCNFRYIIKKEPVRLGETMRTFFVTLMAVFLISLPMSETAEAKRLGGGSSFGKSFTSKKSQSAPAQKQTSYLH